MFLWDGGVAVFLVGRLALGYRASGWVDLMGLGLFLYGPIFLVFREIFIWRLDNSTSGLGGRV